MTNRNDNLIQKCFRKEWTLSEFLRQAGEEEIVSVQIAGMRYNESENEVRRHDFQQTCVNNEASPCGGLAGVHIKAEDVQHIARDVINVIRETILQWFVEQRDTERKAYIHHTILCLKPACSS